MGTPADGGWRALLDSAPDGVVLIDPDGRTILDANVTFCEMVCRPRDELIGGPVESLIESQDLQEMPWASDDASRGTPLIRERWLVRRDGSTVWCQMTARRTHAGLLVFVRDVTAKIADGQRLQQLVQVAQLRTQLTAAILDPEVTLPTVLDRAVRGLTTAIADLAVIALVDRARGLLVPTAFFHRDPACRQALRATLTTRPTELGRGLAGKVAADGVVARLADMSIEQLRMSVAPQYRSYVDRFPLSNLVIVPMRGREGVLGTLGLARATAFGDEDEQVVADFADLLASTIEDARVDIGLRRANFLLQTVTDALPAMVSYWNADLLNEFANDAYREWFRLTPAEIAQRHAKDLVGPEAFEEYLPYIEGALAGERQEYDRTMRDSAGRLRHVHVSYIPDVRPGGHVAGFVALVMDVTPWSEAAAQFEYQALHDPLTGLRNRRSLLDHVALALAKLSRAPGAVALFFLDLDDFKLVNDSYGHSIGDVVLTTTADRIRQITRPGDTAARLGGDEFVLLCPLADRSAAETIRHRLQEALSQPIPLNDGRRLEVSASIGMAVAEDADATTPEGLLAAADEDMFRSKRGEDAAS